MADNLTVEQRKRNMTAIKSRHTKPEIIVRSIIHRLGFRFRLHSTKLVGKPDIVLPKHKKIVLVHGCFWHMHDCKRGNVTPEIECRILADETLSECRKGQRES